MLTAPQCYETDQSKYILVLVIYIDSSFPCNEMEILCALFFFCNLITIRIFIILLLFIIIKKKIYVDIRVGNIVASLLTDSHLSVSVAALYSMYCGLPKNISVLNVSVLSEIVSE